MQKLTVKNFLTLHDIMLDVNHINLIIGPQAQGKSLLAKLVYYFEALWRDYHDMLTAEEPIEAPFETFESGIKENFNETSRNY